MKNKFFSLALSLCLLLSLAACSEKPQEIPSPEEEIALDLPAQIEEDSREDTPIIEEPVDEIPDFIPTVSGRLLPMGDEAFAGFPQGSIATQAELERWRDAMEEWKIVSIEVCDMGEQERELSADAAAGVLNFLSQADLKLYETLENPPTGGSFSVNAYDDSSALVFRTVYNGEWLMVQFAGEDTAYIFDGSEAGLDGLYTCVAE